MSARAERGPRTGPRPAALRVGELVLSLALGTSGTVGVVRGWSRVTIFSTVGASGLLRLCAAAACWLLASVVFDRSRAGSVALQVAALATAIVVTRPNVGGAIGAAGMLGVIAARDVCVGFTPTLRRSRSSASSASSAPWLPMAVACAAQYAWARSGATLVGAGGAGGVIVLAARRSVGGREVQRVEEALGSVARSIIAAFRSVPRRWVRRCRVPRRSVRPKIGRASLLPAVRTWPKREMAIACGAAVALMAPVWWRYSASASAVTATTDYATHLRVARELRLFPLRITAPHPVFHVMTAVFHSVVSWPAASTMSLSIAVAALVVVMIRVGGRWVAGSAPLSPRFSAVCAIGYFVIETPMLVARSLRWGSPYDWATTVHAYHSPTDSFALASSVGLVVGLANVLDGECSERDQRVLGVMSVVAGLVKPSMTIALMAALVPWMATDGRLRRRWATIVRWFLLPSLVVVAAQTLLLEVGSPSLAPAGIAFDPGATVRLLHLGQSSPLILFGFAVIPLAWWGAGRRFVDDRLVRSSLWAIVGGVFVMLAFRETGARSQDGTFAKPALEAMGVAVIISWRVLAGQLAERPSRRGRARAASVRLVLAAALAVAGLAGGVLGYLDAVGAWSLPVAPTR